MEKVLIKILLSTIEDYTGLWEIIWEFNSFTPSQVDEEKKKQAKAILVSLLDQEFVSFYTCKWGSDHREKLSSLAARALMDIDENWNPPKLNDECILVGSTEKGELYYNQIIKGINNG